MKSRTVGKSTSRAEVINVSPNGVWLLAAGREYFLPYDEFPWFKDATVGHILDVGLEHGSHLYWPQLDVDLELESLHNLDNYPLVYR